MTTPAGTESRAALTTAEQQSIVDEIKTPYDPRAREQVFLNVETILAAREAAAEKRGRVEALREAGDELWRVFLRLPRTPSPLGDYLQRRIAALRARADAIEGTTSNE